MPDKRAVLDGPEGPTVLFPHLKTVLAPDWLVSDGAPTRRGRDAEVADDECDEEGGTRAYVWIPT